MKRFFSVVVLLLLLVPSVLADGADDQYIQIYNLIQQGDELSASKPADASAKYTEAQKSLLKFQKIYPGWNERVVNFRLDYLASKITILSANTSAKTNEIVAVKPAPAETPQVTPTPMPETPVTPPAVVQAPAPVTPPVPVPAPTPVVAPAPPGPTIAGVQSQIADLQNQLKQVQSDKMLVEAKLREALSARPAGADPREYAQAQEKLRQMEKENDLLQVSLGQERKKVAALSDSSQLLQTKIELDDTKKQLVEQTARANDLTQQNQALQAQVKALTANSAELVSLRSENAALKKNLSSKSPVEATASNADISRQLTQAQQTIAALQADKEVWRLEKDALQNRVKQLTTAPKVASAPTTLWTQDSDRVKQLERERDDLQKKLDSAQKELYGRNSKVTASRVDDLASQLETLRARLDVFESKPVPYTTEELALFKKPEPAVADPHSGEKSVRELPAGTVQLVADAQRDFSSRSYEQAEQKYLEVLRKDDKNVNTLANLATIQLEMNHFDDAEKNLKAALAISPDDAFALSILGNMKFRQAKYDEALDALSRAAKSDPKNPEIQNFLGLTLSEKGMRSAAETAFRKAIILKPDYGGAQNNLAVFYLTQQPPSIELARWHYDKAIAAGFPRNPEMEKLLNEKKTADSGQ